MTNRTCSMPECDRAHEARGLCGTHYKRWRIYGDPNYVQPSKVSRSWAPEVRFMSKVTVEPGGCWRWSARSNPAGYGLFKTQNVGWFAHRWSFQNWVEPIPTGIHIDHFRYPQDGCIGPACVNPEHLRLATPRENSLRGETVPSTNLAKTHCPQGHPYAGDNLRIRRSGSRLCRTCSRSAMLAYYYRRTATRP